MVVQVSADLAGSTSSSETICCPLCVDAEGALLRANPIVEAWFALLRSRPAMALLALGRLVRGGTRAFADHVAARTEFAAARLPYDETVLNRLQQARAGGRTIALVTALPKSWAAQIAAHLDCIDTVLVHDGEHSWRSDGDGSVLERRFGRRAFDYVGRADSPAWAHARGGIAVTAGGSAEAAAQRVPEATELIVRARVNWRTWLKQVRLHQWVKNLLVFVPLVASRRVADLEMVRAVSTGFLAFGCVASASYILNDLLDLPHDRLHPTKRLRPLAAGTLSIRSAITVMTGLLAVSVLLATTLPATFAEILALYSVGTLGYSLFLKRIAPLDAFALAGLYTLRVLAGNAASGLPPSFWLLAFSIFLFLSLAMAKRHAELAQLNAAAVDFPHGRGYRAGDLQMVSQLGVGSGYISVLVLALYLNSPEAAALYRRPDLLWLLCALLLYWITRLWLLAHRGELDDDPVVFALRDRGSRIVALCVIVVLLLA